MRRERRNIKTKVRKREVIVNEESFFGGKGVFINFIFTHFHMRLTHVKRHNNNNNNNNDNISV